MSDPRSLSDIVAFTARQKLAAARARRNPNAMAEKPREAILDGLRIVGEVIAEDGYIFSHSRPAFIQKRGDLAFQISIQSDRNNVAGQRAAIWVHAAIYSRTFTAWSKNHRSDWIRSKAPFPLPFFATQLGYLCEPNGWMEWDFADRAKRQFIAADLIASIRAGAYPLFATFEGGAEEIARLVIHDLPSPEGILSYLLSTGYTNLADKALHRYLDQRPDFRGHFEGFSREFAENEVPKYRKGGAHDLAAFAVATGYPWSV